MSYALIQETRERLQQSILLSHRQSPHRILSINCIASVRILINTINRVGSMINSTDFALRTTLSTILVLHDNTLELPRNLSNLQIHRLFLHADYQRKGLG